MKKNRRDWRQGIGYFYANAEAAHADADLNSEGSITAFHDHHDS